MLLKDTIINFTVTIISDFNVHHILWSILYQTQHKISAHGIFLVITKLSKIFILQKMLPANSSDLKGNPLWCHSLNYAHNSDYMYLSVCVSIYL